MPLVQASPELPRVGVVWCAAAPLPDLDALGERVGCRLLQPDASGWFDGYLRGVLCVTDDPRAAERVMAQGRSRSPMASRMVALTGGAAPTSALFAEAHHLVAGRPDLVTVIEALRRVALVPTHTLPTLDPELQYDLDRLPPVPHTVTALVAALEVPEPDMQAVIGLLTQDPALLAKTLQLANSAWFGSPRRVADVQTAVVYLGLNTIRAAIFTAGILEVLRNVPQAALEAIQARGLVAARLSRLVDGGAHAASVSAAMLAGVGRLVVLSTSPAKHERIEAALLDGRSRLDVERAVLGATTGQIGARFLARWGLPEPVCRAVAISDAPWPSVRRGLDLAATTWLSVRLASAAADGLAEPDVDPAWAEAVGVRSALPAWWDAVRTWWFVLPFAA